MARSDDINRWFDDDCAKMFWDQRWAVPYQELLHDTLAWLDPKPGERWLDLGCGSGQLSAALWKLSDGQVCQVVGYDGAAINARAFERWQRNLVPRPGPDQMPFVVGDFSKGLPEYDDATFDGIVSGMAMCYAESKDPVTNRYDDTAYNRLLAETQRVLKPGGRLIFSVIVPRPRFWRVFWKSLRMAFKLSKPFEVLANGLKMQSHGRWLRREAARGRFHFLPLDDLTRRLEGVGFRDIQAKLSFARQAYLLTAGKNPVAVPPSTKPDIVPGLQVARSA